MIQITSFKRNQIMSKNIKRAIMRPRPEVRIPFKGEGSVYVVG